MYATKKIMFYIRTASLAFVYGLDLHFYGKRGKRFFFNFIIDFGILR